MCEVSIAPSHVGRRIEGDCTGEQRGMLGDEEQRFLPAHRASDRVDAVRIDPHTELLDDFRHSGEIVDLTRVAP